MFDLINSYKNDLNFIDINNITIYLVYYFSHFEEYSQMDVNNVIKDLINLPSNIIKNISIKRFTPYFDSYNRESIINILNYSWNGDIINLYFNLMTFYNIFLRNSELINIKAIFIETHFFNKLQECYFSDIYDNLLHLYKEDLFIDDTFIFDIKDNIIAIPIYTYKNIESQNEENKLFLAVCNYNTKKIVYLDSNDITFKNAKSEDAVSLVPMDRILIETDSPYLSPEPLRGTRNTSINVKYVAEKISSIKGLSLEEVARATYKNAMDIYNI